MSKVTELRTSKVNLDLLLFLQQLLAANRLWGGPSPQVSLCEKALVLSGFVRRGGNLPWMSSLNMQYLLRYLLRRRKALALAKSSNWMRQFIPNLWRGRGKSTWLPPRADAWQVPAWTGEQGGAGQGWVWVWHGSFTGVYATWLASGLLALPAPLWFSYLFLIEVELIYNVVLISAVQQSDSVTHTYILFFLKIYYSFDNTSHVIKKEYIYIYIFIYLFIYL